VKKERKKERERSKNIGGKHKREKRIERNNRANKQKQSFPLGVVFGGRLKVKRSK
jgi:hypothetical protein